MSAVPPVPENTSRSTLAAPETSPHNAVRDNASAPRRRPSVARNGTEVTPPKSLSQTGRSKTAPLSLDVLWTPSVDQPQLSERDSIFATTYTADSPIQSPIRSSSNDLAQEKRMGEHCATAGASPIRKLIEPPLLKHHVSPLPSSSHPLEKVRSTSDLPTPVSAPIEHQRPSTPLRKHESPIEETDTITPYRIHPPFMSPVDTPDRPSTPHHHEFSSSDLAKLQDSDERLRYRSWREGNATLPEPATKLTLARMEKKIEAQLPKAEQTQGARSRKTSHYLGLFKGNDEVQEQKRREERARDREQDNKQRRNEPPELVTAAYGHSLSMSPTQENPASPRFPSEPPREPHPKSSEGIRPKPISEYGEDTIAESEPPMPLHPAFPPSLLEEIRQHHNLTPGADSGSSFSRSLPTTASEKARPPSLLQSPHSGYDHERSEYFPSVPGRSYRRSSPSDEEDESETEQISSALYIPHRQIATEQSEREGDTACDEIKLSRQETASTDKSKISVQSRESAREKTPEAVEISLQGQDDIECLHGNLPRTSSLPGDIPQVPESPSIGAASDGYDTSYTDSAQSQGYESSATEDLGTTPTPAQPSHQPVKKEKHKAHPPAQPPAPIGAVELKPYDHQVGGHTTVYRFSRRAVCKQLNNRENVFYEIVERNHPELLEFLPR